MAARCKGSPVSLLTAEHGLSIPLAITRELIADSACWQAICTSPDSTWSAIKAAADAGGLNRNLALSRIVADTVYEDEEFQEANLPPWVLLRHGTDSQEVWSSTSSFETEASIQMTIELTTPEHYRGYSAESIWNATTHFQNCVGRILSDMKAVVIAKTAGRLPIEAITRGVIGAYPPAEFNGRWVRTAEFYLRYRGVC